MKQATTSAAGAHHVELFGTTRPSKRVLQKNSRRDWLHPGRWVRRCEQPSDVDDHPSSGRPPIANQAAQQRVLEAAQLSDCKTAAGIAAKTKHNLGKQLSCSTARSILGQNGLTHMSPRGILFLTAKQKPKSPNLPKQPWEDTLCHGKES